MLQPTDEHWSAVKRVLRYLVGTQTHEIFIRANTPTTLHGFSDADWAHDTYDFVSTNAYVIYLSVSPISWSSKKQHDVARSSMKAEYRAVPNDASEVRWIRSLLTELGRLIPTPHVIYYDNVRATHLSANLIFHS